MKPEANRLQPLRALALWRGRSSWRNSRRLGVAWLLVALGLGWPVAGADRRLVVGSEQDFPPLALGRTDETAGGFTVELWRVVAKEQGLDYTIRVRPFAQLLEEFKAGQIDVLVNLARSDARRKFADFSVTHVTVHGAMFVRSGGSGIRTEADLAGKSIIVLNADLAHDYAVARGWEPQLVPVATAADAFKLLATGQHDVVLINKVVGLQTLADLKLSNIRALPAEAGFAQKFAFAVHKGDTDLLDRLNEGLALVKASGLYDAIYEKWFGIYETKGSALRDVLKFLVPLVVLLLGWQAIYFHRLRLGRQQAAAAEVLNQAQAVAHMGSWQINVKGDKLTWSDETYRIFGLPLGTPLNYEAFLACVHPDDRAAVDRAWQAALQGAPYDLEHRIIAGEAVKWVRAQARLKFDARGRLQGGMGTVRDITERKHSELWLRQLSSAVEQTADAVMITDRDGVIQYVNQAFEVDSGYRMEEIIGQRPSLLKSGQHEPRFYESLWQTITAGKVFRAEFINRRKDGTLFHEETTITPIRNREGEVTHFVSTAKNITERRRLEQAVRETEALHQSLVENLPQCIFRKDREGRFTFVNQRFCDTVGRPRAEVLGRTDTDLFPVELATKYRADDDRVMATRQPYIAVEDHVSSGNQHRFVEVIKTPALDSAGNVIGVQGIFSDVTERETAAQALRESEAGLAMIFRASPAAISINTVADGRLIEVNDRYCEFFGYAREELLGKTILELKLWANPGDRVAAMQRLQRDGAVQDLEARYRRRSGEVRDVLVSMELIELAGESEPVMIAMFTDITERKQAETALTQERRLLRTVIDNLPGYIFVKDQQGRYLVSNRAHVRLLGAESEAELIGKTVFDFFPATTARRYTEDDARLLSTGVPVSEREETYEANGQHHWSLLTKVPLRDSQGNIIGLVGIKQDITPRKLAEAERARLTQQMQMILQSTDEGIYGLDLTGRCTFINRAGAQILGAPPDELLGRNMHELAQHHRADGSAYPADESPITNTCRTGERCRVNTEVFWRQDGSTVCVEYAAYPILEGGIIRGAVVVFSDITDRKQMEEQFMRSQRMEAIGTLAGGIAHDLNNALAPVIMGAEFLRATCADESVAEVLDTIQDSAKRGAGMVKQLLTFARGTAGERGVIQIKHLAKEIVGITRQTFPKTIQVRSDIATEIWPLVGDPTQLHQVLLNLCVNARDAMPDGGTLTLTARNAQLGDDYAGLPHEAKLGPYVVLAVTDTGTGMTPEVRARIFETFFTTKPPGKGTGLGLSTVQGIVKDHGGFLTVDTAVGRGTTFKVHLPAQASAKPPAATEEHPAVPMGHDELILVVDDEDSVLNLATRALKRFNYRVLTARNGREALAIYRDQASECQLLITDMDMPVMNGPALIRVLQRAAPQLKIIASSGMDSSHVGLEQSAPGVKAFLQKPYGAEHLLRTVHAVLAETAPT